MQSKSHNSSEIYGFWAVILASFVMHFRDLSIFSRELLMYDDQFYIGPLKTMSLGRYFGVWFPERDNYAFPLRDLTFYLDFKFSEILGIETFWLQNFVYFAATMFLVFQIFRILYPSILKFTVLIMGVIALHPIQIEMIQWASLRKHLLVGVLVSWGTLAVFRIQKQLREPSRREWIFLFSVYLLSLMAWPTGILWIFWVLYMFRYSLIRDLNRMAFIISAATGIFILYFSSLTTSKTYYGQGINNVVTSEGSRLATSFFNITHALGRAIGDTLFPFFIVPISNPEHPITYIGMALGILLLLILIYFSIGKGKISRDSQFLSLLILTVLLFVPVLLTLVSAKDFVWSDRFIYVAFPFFVLTMLRFLELVHLTRFVKPMMAVSVTFLFCSLWIHARQVSDWSQTSYLFERCYERDQSLKCLVYSLERAFDDGGCAKAFPIIEKIEQTKSSQKESIIEISTNVPFYAAHCISSATNLTPDQKKRELDRIPVNEANRLAVEFSQIGVMVEAGQIMSGFDLLNRVFLNPAIEIPNTTTRIVNLYRGMSQAFCELDQFASGCPERLIQLELRTTKIPKDTTAMQWAYRYTRHMIEVGQIKKRQVAGEN